MATVLNIPSLAYYQRRYNVRLPRRAESKKWIDVTGIAIVPTLRFSPPYPWETLDNAALNSWVEDQDLDVPPNWFSLSLTAKKAYLVINYGEPAP